MSKEKETDPKKTIPDAKETATPSALMQECADPSTHQGGLNSFDGITVPATVTAPTPPISEEELLANLAGIGVYERDGCIIL